MPMAEQLPNAPYPMAAISPPEMVKAGLAIDWPKYSGGKYRSLEVPDARKKMWLADARQKGRMHVWEQFEAKQKARAARD